MYKELVTCIKIHLEYELLNILVRLYAKRKHNRHHLKTLSTMLKSYKAYVFKINPVTKVQYSKLIRES